jgi:hypothetical protein
MSTQSRRDLIAAVSIGLMFLGAFMLPVSWLGLVLIGGGGTVMLLLILMAVREQ